MQEFDPLPDKADTLEQDALAALGRLGSDKLCRYTRKIVTAGDKGGSCGADESHRDRNDKQHGIKKVIQIREAVHQAVDLPDDRREKPASEEETADASEESGASGVNEVFRHDRARTVAERL